MITEEKIKQIVPGWEQVKHLITLRIVHRDVDISNYVGCKFLDMNSYPVIPLDERITVKVTSSLCKLWNKTETDVFDQAIDNIEAICETIEPKPLSRIIHEMADIEISEKQDEPVMLTNPDKCFGAYTMFDINLMNRVAKHFDTDELIVLPSSVHEVWVMPMTKDIDIQNINKMIQEVNKTQVHPSEWLSDHAYICTVGKGFRW